MNHWLFKSEPEVFSIEDLQNSKNQTSSWEGIRNYQARNFLRDNAKPNDRVLFYYSSANPTGVVGTAKILTEGYVDHFAFDKKSDYYDKKSKPEKPQWYMVDVKFETKFKRIVTLDEIKSYKELSEMRLVQKGNRLSVFPITKKEFELIENLGQKI
jgi:predicted RNA-binding protein with PUA-like domain